MVRLAVGGDRPGFESYDEVIAAEDGADIDDPVLGTQMLYTSGTTGRPKGVHREGQAPSALATVNFCGYDEDWEHSVDAHLCTGPLYHAAPLAFSIALPVHLRRARRDHGAVGPGRDAAADRAARHHPHPHGADHVPPPAGPARRRAAGVTTCRRCASSSTAPRPARSAVKQALIEWLGPIVVEYYAATEGLGTLVDSATWLAHPGTVGRPMLADQVKVADDDGNPVAAGRDRPGLPASLGRQQVRLLRRRREDRPTPSGATTSPWATWATWTTRASCS